MVMSIDWLVGSCFNLNVNIRKWNIRYIFVYSSSLFPS